MTFMNWVIDNWYVLVVRATMIAAGIWIAYQFLKLPVEQQKEKVKEWLIWACIESEKKLQSDTGQLKLRDVYDKFCAVPAFKWFAVLISFKRFSDLVSKALITAKKMLISNTALAEYVYGTNAQKEIEKIKKQLETAQ
ncbi:MAG: hypothetical protein J6B68_03920 [Lachnospiraceae bacterium]|nr:hypothetical protein [Lachnospiraceae bacterium]